MTCPLIAGSPLLAAHIARSPIDLDRVLVRFIALEGTLYVLQQPAYCMSIVSLAGLTAELPPGSRVVEVLEDGANRKLRRIDDTTVSVSPPIPLTGRRVTVVCLAPKEPQQAPKARLATTPAPDLSYGLGAREWAVAREAQQ